MMGIWYAGVRMATGLGMATVPISYLIYEEKDEFGIIFMIGLTGVESMIYANKTTHEVSIEQVNLTIAI